MRKTFIRIFTIADYENEERWLRQQHQDGWKLVNMTPPCVYTFEDCEPEDVIYRLDFKNSEQTEEYMQMVEDFGWEYFAKCMGWLYFRKPASAVDAEGEDELFSDGASKAEMARHIARTRLLPLLVIFLCCVLPNLLRAIDGRTSGFYAFIGTFFGVMFVLYVFLLAYCGIKLTKIKNRYQR